MAEDVKNMMDMPVIIVKWSRYLRDLVDREVDNGVSVMMTILEDFIKEGRYNAIWRFLEITKYRNQVLAARRRAEESFESNGSSHP